MGRGEGIGGGAKRRIGEEGREGASLGHEGRYLHPKGAELHK